VDGEPLARDIGKGHDKAAPRHFLREDIEDDAGGMSDLKG
jgi:hypothetical protein